MPCANRFLTHELEDTMLRTPFALLLALLAASASLAQEADLPFLNAAPGALDWWREARFGLFVHWGPVSLRGTEIGWSRGGERRGTGGTGEIPVEEYDSLYTEFDPTAFDADEWVAIAKAAGMRYLVLTTKHHDGFCMFDSALTDYKVTNSPIGRDLTAELADACHRGGLRLGFYYSPPDWRHPDYRTADHQAYVDYLHGQIRELCTNYGRVDIIWFDGLGGTAEDWDAVELFRMIRELQPGVLINNRAGLTGDFGTPEQVIGHYDPTNPWESCITIGQQWSYRPDDQIKSLEQCIETLVRCAGGDGNLLLNVGPMPTGAIEPSQVDRLMEVGEWLRSNGDTIYGTRGGPFRPGPWGAATCRGRQVFVHVLDVQAEDVLLPPMEARILSAALRDGTGVAFSQGNSGVALRLPEAGRHPLDTVVTLSLDRPALDAEVGLLASGSLAHGRPVVASNVFSGMAEFGPDKALDDDPETRWATDAGTSEATLAVDLGEDTEIAKVHVSEAFARVSSFRLERLVDGEWVAFYEGQSLGEAAVIEFEPISVRHLRLSILAASEGPTIWEFQVFPPAD
jgi:alpha-L-fucosidase